jgi:hypothetical protein
LEKARSASMDAPSRTNCPARPYWALRENV